MRYDRAVERQAYREQRQHLRLAAVSQPDHKAGPGQQQRAIQSGAGDDRHCWNVMSGVSRKINGRQAAGEEHLRVIFERFLFALKPDAQTEQRPAQHIEQSYFAAGPNAADEIFVGVGSKKDDTGQQHHNANANQPVSAESQLK